MSGRSAFAETPLLKHTKSGKTGHRLVGTLYHTCIGFKDRFPPCLPKAFRKARDRDGEGAGRHGPDRRCMAGSMRNRAARGERTGCGPADAQNGKGGRQAKARCAEREITFAKHRPLGLIFVVSRVLQIMLSLIIYLLLQPCKIADTLKRRLKTLKMAASHHPATPYGSP